MFCETPLPTQCVALSANQCILLYTAVVVYCSDQFRSADGVLTVPSPVLCMAPLRVSQGAPLEELLKGLETISDIKDEWDIDLHHVTKGLVSKSPGLPYSCFCVDIFLFFAINPHLSPVSEQHEGAYAHKKADQCSWHRNTIAIKRCLHSYNSTSALSLPFSLMDYSMYNQSGRAHSSETLGD